MRITQRQAAVLEASDSGDAGRDGWLLAPLFGQVRAANARGEHPSPTNAFSAESALSRIALPYPGEYFHYVFKGAQSAPADAMDKLFPGSTPKSGQGTDGSPDSDPPAGTVRRRSGRTTDTTRAAADNDVVVRRKRRVIG